MRPAARSRKQLPFFISTVAMLLFGNGRITMAGTINGFTEWNYSGLNTSSRTDGGESSSTRIDSFIQRYNLSLITNPLPALRLSAGGLFEQQFNGSDIQGPGKNSTHTTWQPYVDLAMLNPVYNAGIGYSRREESLHATSTPTSRQINDDYRVLLGWRPLGLPTMDLQLTRTNRYDPERVQQDSSTDRASLSLRYLPVKNLDLRYQFVYNDAADRLQDLEITETSHTGRVSYSGDYFDKRVALFTNYNLNAQNVTTSAGGTGFVDFQTFPAFGLSSLSDTPQTGTLATDSPLIDGATTVSSGINIGVVLPPGDTRRNLGVDFFAETEINRILVWIDRDLPAAIASSYSWEIYTSSDNTTWTLWRTLASAPFGPFEKRFDLQFDLVKTRYIKVVTRPLSSVAATLVPSFRDADRIFVTELQTFQRRTAADTRGKTTSTSQMYSLDVKARILDNPSLYYKGSFLMTAGGTPSTHRSTLINGLSVDRRLTEKMTVTGRVAREDIDDPTGKTTGYAYDASLRANPLKTVSDSLVYSGRVDFKPAGTSKINSLFAYNTAEIYRGVNLNLGGGVSFATNEQGVNTKGTNVLFGLNLVPTRTLTTNLTYSLNRSVVSGEQSDQGSSSTQRGEASVAWRPFTTLYLYTALGFLSQTGRPSDMTQNYGVNWSPFPDGTLQFNFAFNQNLQTQNSERTRLITPSVAWQITSRMVLDASYSLLNTDSTQGRTDVRILGTNLRINF
jgi:hypothetical protein